MNEDKSGGAVREEGGEIRGTDLEGEVRGGDKAAGSRASSQRGRGWEREDTGLGGNGEKSEMRQSVQEKGEKFPYCHTSCYHSPQQMTHVLHLVAPFYLAPVWRGEKGSVPSHSSNTCSLR